MPTEKTDKPVKLVKNPKTEAEKAGIKTVAQKEKEIKQVLDAPKKRGRPAKPKDAPVVVDSSKVESQPQIIYVQQVEPKKTRAKRVLTEEQKAVLRDRLIKARAVRQEKKTASQTVEVEA